MYARVPRSKTGNGIFLISETSIAFDGVAGYYHLWVAGINSEYEGKRSFFTLYGWTEILPGQVFTRIISDPDRNLIIDFLARKIIAENGAEIIGKIVFSAGTSGYNNISDRPNFDEMQDNWLFDANLYARQIAQQLANMAQSNATANAITSIESARNAIAQNLGYASYADLQQKAAAGQIIIQGGHIRTALIDANAIVTSELVAQRITAAMIEAKLLRVGNFTISNGWLRCNATAGVDGFIDMQSDYTRVTFGSDLAPATAGGGYTCPAKITNNKISNTGGNTIALMIEAAGNSQSKSIAISADGGIIMKGCLSLVEKVYTLNYFTQSNNADPLRYHNTFVLQPTSPVNAYLPNATAIQNTFGWFKDGDSASETGFIRMKIIVTRWATSAARINGDSSAPIIDNNGNIWQTNYIEMERGDILELGYHNGAWYVFNRRN